METKENNNLVVGTCLHMCPENEIIMREQRNLIHPFELQCGKKRVDSNRAVKEYSRPAAGKSDPVPSELRPGQVLLATVNYLINQIIPIRSHPWHYVYEFVFDRLRAVRQDLTIQRIHDSHAVHVLERAVRVMVYAQYRLCECQPSQFDVKINSTHVQECLKRLLCLYEQSSTCSCHQEEFVALYLMFNLGRSEALEYGLEKKRELSGSGTFNLALSISLAWWRRNYSRVLRLSIMLPVLHMCAMTNVRSSIICDALKVMSVAYHSKASSFPLPDLCQMLHIDRQMAAREMCESCGLKVSPGGGVQFQRGSIKDDANVSPSLQNCIEDDLEWEDIPLLLIGSKCSCLSSTEVT